MSAEFDGARVARGANDTRGPRRLFTDAAGRLWQVHEAPHPAFDRRAGTCLVFACEEAIRRVRVFPADWFTLSDAELLQLSWNR